MSRTVPPQSAAGFAVYDPLTGLIDVSTVQNTERGAMVNGLIVINRVMVTTEWDDERIRTTWIALNNTQSHHKIVPVVITAASID